MISISWIFNCCNCDEIIKFLILDKLVSMLRYPFKPQCCHIDWMHFWDTNKCPSYFLSFKYPPKWSSLAKDLANVICLIDWRWNTKQNIYYQSWKMCFKLLAKRYFSWAQKSVHLHCYGFFKWRLHVFSHSNVIGARPMYSKRSESDIKTRECHLACLYFPSVKNPKFQ